MNAQQAKVYNLYTELKANLYAYSIANEKSVEKGIKAYAEIFKQLYISFATGDDDTHADALLELELLTATIKDSVVRQIIQDEIVAVANWI